MGRNYFILTCDRVSVHLINLSTTGSSIQCIHFLPLKTNGKFYFNFRRSIVNVQCLNLTHLNVFIIYYNSLVT